jgi:hypothetical protein
MTYVVVSFPAITCLVLGVAGYFVMAISVVLDIRINGVIFIRSLWSAILAGVSLVARLSTTKTAIS